LAELREAVAAATEHNTVYLDDRAEAQSYLKDAKGAMPFIDCIGAQLAPLDLLPPRFTQKKKKAGKSAADSQSLTVGFVGLGILIVASVVLTLLGLLRWNESRAANEKMIADIAELEYTELVYNSYLEYTAGADAVVNVRTLTSSPNDNLVAFLKELERKMPSEILVLSATCASENVVLTATVPLKSDVARVMVQLRSFESLGALSMPSITETEDETGVKRVSFAITCQYKLPEQIVEAAIGGEGQ
jgi:hypothetical protein